MSRPKSSAVDRMDEPVAPQASKTQRKKAMLALQDLGVELVKLPAEQLRKLVLPENLRGALLDWQRFSKHEARRRQMQYIGRLMRDLDAEPIAEQLAIVRGESDSAKAEFHALERWRERLLADDDAVTQWLALHRGSDAQKLRQLVRNARSETEQGTAPKSSRELFRLLREASAEGQGPAADQG